MNRMVEVILDEAALADLGIPVEPLGYGLDDLPPDPLADHYGAILSLHETPPEGGSMRAVMDEVVGIRRRLAELQADEHRALARLSTLALEGAELPVRPDATDHKAKEIAHRTMVAELATVTRMSSRTMEGKVAESALIASRFPKTLEHLADGHINSGHVDVIVQYGLALSDDDIRSDYETAVLEHAVDVAPGRLRRFAELTAARLGSETFEQRHERAAAARSVRVRKLEDGMSELIHTVPTVLAAGIWDRLTKQATALTRAGDPRSFDQLRADLAAELLLAGEPSAADGSPHALARALTAEVAIVIPALTLLGLSDEPATLAGQGPIGLAEARELAANAPSLVRIITHPVSGMVLSVDTYRPSEQLRRFLRVRDGRYRFPGCSSPPGRCDLDHTVAAEVGGPTKADNLAHLCRGHHTLKHHGGWSVRQRQPGVLEWTSPHGYTVTDRPEPTVSFVA